MTTTDGRSARTRVVIVNHDGGPMTMECLTTVLASNWPADRLEVVLVDNGSQDGIAARVRRELPAVRVIESHENLGFAGGCNLGLQDPADTEQIALINNDAVVSPDWLMYLTETLESASDIGAACPKIVFRSPFLELCVWSETHQRSGDPRALGVRISGARIGDRDVWARTQLVNGFWGPEYGTDPEAVFEWTTGEAALRVPVASNAPTPDRCQLRLAGDAPITVESSSGDVQHSFEISASPAWYDVPLDGLPVDIINNAGNELVNGEFGADRGYLEPDDGRLDTPVDVFAWCGGAVLLRRDYLDHVGLFDERLFLYYEDIELSWRGRALGWRYRYDPRAVVRHLHSATTGQHAARAEHFKTRNRLLVLTRHAPIRTLIPALTRELLVTGSYARRDLVVPTLRGRDRSGVTVGQRLRAFGAYLRLAPAMLRSRQRDRRRARQL